MDDALQKKLAALRSAYAKTLPGLLEALGGAIRDWRASPEDPARRDEVRRLAHRLVGTSGSYGFTAVSDATRTIEGLVEKLPNQPGHPDVEAALLRAVQAASEAAAA
jgi:chemotaxis protein histidine kinase CheA